MKKAGYILLCILFVCCGKKQAEEVDYQNNDCRRMPPFVSRLGYAAGAQFSTSDKWKMGLLLMHGNADPNPYRHPSWSRAGWLAPIQLDESGNLFTAPAPAVNVLYNVPDSQNRVYKVDGQSGVMYLFVQLDKPEQTENQNPYGVLGLCYMCETRLLYASTVAGSTRTKEAGGIYCVDADGKIKDRIMGFDPFGIGISYIEGKRKIYYGLARTPEIYSIDLTASGKFAGKPVLVASLEGLGPRGDDKAKRIRFSQKGDMTVEGYEFNFNLIAPAEKQATNYYFHYDQNAGKWVQTSEGAVK